MQILLYLYEVEICQLSTANFVFYLFTNYLPFTGLPRCSPRGNTKLVIVLTVRWCADAEHFVGEAHIYKIPTCLLEPGRAGIRESDLLSHYFCTQGK
jgi:hypothetical protein